MKAVRPLEYLCFSAFPLPAKLDSKMWAFIAIDLFTKQEFLLDICEANDDETTLQNIEMLLEDEEFNKNRTEKFTLILKDCNFKFKSEIDTILEPEGGISVFDNEIVQKEIDRVLKDLDAAFFRK